MRLSSVQTEYCDFIYSLRHVYNAMIDEGMVGVGMLFLETSLIEKGKEP